MADLGLKRAASVSAIYALFQIYSMTPGPSKEWISPTLLSGTPLPLRHGILNILLICRLPPYRLPEKYESASLLSCLVLLQLALSGAHFHLGGRQDKRSHDVPFDQPDYPGDSAQSAIVHQDSRSSRCLIVHTSVRSSTLQHHAFLSVSCSFSSISNGAILDRKLELWAEGQVRYFSLS